MFEPPFSPVFIGTWVVGIVGGGVWLIVNACRFQNKKHGFTK